MGSERRLVSGAEEINGSFNMLCCFSYDSFMTQLNHLKEILRTAHLDSGKKKKTAHRVCLVKTKFLLPLAFLQSKI